MGGVLTTPPLQHSKPPSGSPHYQAMNSGHQPSWERLIAWLVVGAISLQVLAVVLPRLLVPLVVLAVVVVIVRLVWWYTQL